MTAPNSNPQLKTDPRAFVTKALLVVVKTTLWLLLWGVALFWLLAWWFVPIKAGSKLTSFFINHTTTSFIGDDGPIYLLYSGPFIAIALLGMLYLELQKRFPNRIQNFKGRPTSLRRLWKRRYTSIWTQPILVRGPLGIVTVMDIFLLAIVVATVLWLFLKSVIPQFHLIDAAPPGKLQKYQQKLGYAGVVMGRIAAFPLALLFIPVSRGSPILRLVDVPFEHAVKYHKWLGHITLTLFATHGLTFIVLFASEHAIYKLGYWKVSGISILAGVIALIAGLMMWITSIGPIRRLLFDVFYVAHHLYIIFLAFFVFHVGDKSAGYVLGGIFLFFLDRFIRMVQSCQTVSILSAQLLPTGVMELKFPKFPDVDYSALSFMYFNVRDISLWQWHPFSATSSPLDGTNNISVCIKPLGGWTKKLHASIHDESMKNPNSTVVCPFGMKLFVEGPYGHESNYFLRYKVLLLVAGGIGITPFLAVIRDLLHRHQQEEDGLPTNIELIWSMKNKSELTTLKGIHPTRLFSNYSEGKCKIDVKAYVTTSDHTNQLVEDNSMTKPGESYLQDLTNRKLPSPIVGTGNNLWVAGVIVSATFGFMLMLGVFHKYVVYPHDHPDHGKPFPQWIQVLFFFASMLIGIVGFGGIVIGAWNLHISSSTLYKTNTSDSSNDLVEDLENEEVSLLDKSIVTITEGTRPKFSELFEVAEHQYEGEDVGVLVCGPKGLQECVAAECRSKNFSNSKTQFHYHSVSFNL